MENKKQKNKDESVVNLLLKLLEEKDPYTIGHDKQVAKLSIFIAKEMNFNQGEIKKVEIASILHDIGKIFIPSNILNKPSQLTEEEYSFIKRHSEIGCRILEIIGLDEFIPEIVKEHHEKINGSGYPRGLKTNEILLPAKILCVSDVVEAMLSDRPYRKKLSIEEAIEEITKNRGILYEPVVVDICIRIFKNGFKF